LLNKSHCVPLCPALINLGFFTSISDHFSLFLRFLKLASI
jgi:hypothetical protein